MKSKAPFHLGIALLCMIWLVGTAFGQTPDEHAKHHPAPGGANADASGPSSTGSMPAPGIGPAQTAPGAMDGNQPAGGGMGAGMGEMMKQMGVPPRKELYPSLMALPDEVTPQMRAGIEQLAQEHMKAGTALLSSGLEKLSRSTSGQDYAAMQQAAAQMREGLAEFEAGIAAQRVLSEGKAPRNLALDWFKREMNLASPIRPNQSPGLLGVTPFHLFTMTLLVGFSTAMVVMYFFKMRRAAALFGRLDADSKSPSGVSLPLAGTSRPSAPDGEKSPSIPVPTAEKKQATEPAGPTKVGDTAPLPDKPQAQPADGGSLAVPGSQPATAQAASASPMTANWRGKLRVASIVTETPGVKTLRLVPSPDAPFLPFTFVPGQFLNVAFWIGGTKMNRSYSISSSPTRREYVDLTVRREPRGAVSRHMDDLLNVGDLIDAGGPVGKFTFTGTEAESIVLISAGVGITPMMSIARYLTERSWAGEIFFIYTCHTQADFIFADQVAALERVNPKLHVGVTISKPEGTDWKGARGRITKEWLTQTVPDLASRRIHVCGPPSMMESTKAILAELGVPPDRLKTEAFGAVKPAPVAPGTTAKPSVPATGPMVTFSKNNKSAKIHVDLQSGDSPPLQTILELSEELGIGIEFSCRVGTCGLCKVKMTSGEVEMEVQDALDADDNTNGMILACQAKPKSAVAVDA